MHFSRRYILLHNNTVNCGQCKALSVSHDVYMKTIDDILFSLVRQDCGYNIRISCLAVL